MNPTELRIQALERQIEAIKALTDVRFVENLIRRGIGSVSVEPGASTTGTAQSVRNASGTGSETVADTYNGVLTLTDQEGNTYRIGYYT